MKIITTDVTGNKAKGGADTKPDNTKTDDLPNGEDTSAKIIPAHATRGGDFIAAYVPIYYALDGILPSGFLYGMTARRSGGKTAELIMATCAVIKGDEKIMGCDVEGGRVAYVIKENPIDFQMKLSVNLHFHGIGHETANEKLLVLDGRPDSPEQIAEKLKMDAGERGDFKLICYDTFQSGFAAADGVQFNDNAEVLKFVIRLRPLTEIVGNPPMLIAFHPIKNATEDDLIPYGGGSIINELDGNLTLWGPPNQLKLYHNKVRGPEFDPKYFSIEMKTCPHIVDQKGQLIQLPVCGPLTEREIEDKKANSAEIDLALLRVMSFNPKGSQRQWMDAAKIKSTGSLSRALGRMKTGGLVENVLDRWVLKPKGKQFLKDSDPDDN